jgi:hypothetical protein
MRNKWNGRTLRHISRNNIYQKVTMTERTNNFVSQMTMDDLINKYLELLIFVPYIREDKVKIQ